MQTDIFDNDIDLYLSNLDQRGLIDLEAKIKVLKTKFSHYKAPQNVGVGALVRDLIDKGYGNKEIQTMIAEHYGNNNTSYACIAWYRNNLKQLQK